MSPPPEEEKTRRRGAAPGQILSQGDARCENTSANGESHARSEGSNVVRPKAWQWDDHIKEAVVVANSIPPAAVRRVALYDAQPVGATKSESAQLVHGFIVAAEVSVAGDVDHASYDLPIFYNKNRTGAWLAVERLAAHWRVLAEDRTSSVERPGGAA